MAKARASTTPHFWREEETDLLLSLVKEMNVMAFIDGRKHRDSDVYNKVAAKLLEAGFVRTPDQIKHRWKSLKAAYYKAKHFCLMEKIWGETPPIPTGQNSGVDVGVEKQQQPAESDQESDETSASEDSTSSTGTSGSGSLLGGELGDGVQENGARGPSIQPSNTTAPPQPSKYTATTPGGSGHKSRPRGAALLAQQQEFMERMQHTQNQWFERQTELRHARDEALMSRLIAETTRSTRLLVTQIVAGLGTVLQQPSQFQPTLSQTQPIYNPQKIDDNYGLPPPPQPMFNGDAPTPKIDLCGLPKDF